MAANNMTASSAAASSAAASNRNDACPNMDMDEVLPVKVMMVRRMVRSWR
jgi:hypothetical protein